MLWGDWYGLDPRAGIGKGRQFLCEAGGDANKAWERAVDLRIQRNWEALTPEGKELREAENYLWAYYAVENGQNHWYGTTAVASVYLGILIPGWQALRLIENSAGAQLQSPASFDAMLAGNLGVLDGAGSSLK
ncbi:MAG: hypothetical protein LBL72_06680 [Candidatus Accumulibacter sp.]|nr:hypothetical protein [Accumulibacter sp.]